MPADSQPLVTIGLPIYKRLEFLPQVLKLIEAQDHPHIDLLVSDNGVNGDRVREIVAANYSRPYRFRQNPATVEVMTHWNQLIQEAQGKYFLLLCDDDEISANYVSVLAGQLERHPEAALAFSGQEVLDFSGNVLKSSSASLPSILPGGEFILATWQRYAYGFKSVTTFLARTERVRAVGGFPCFTRGTHPDDALVVMLSLDSHVVLSPECVWRNRLYESSHGMSLPIADLAAATREFIQFLDTNPTIQDFAYRQPSQWAPLRKCLVKMAWQTYLIRWDTLYRKRMSYPAWVRAGFAMPFIPAYYRGVARALTKHSKTAFAAWMGRTPRAPADESSQAA